MAGLALAAAPVRADEVDAEHIFGFTQGSEIGEAGGRTFEAETAGRFGLRRGSYRSASSDITALLTLTDNFRVAPALTFDSFHARGVPGLADRFGTLIEGPSVDLKYRVLDYKTDAFGLTFGATPYYARVDAFSGSAIQGTGTNLLLALDRALVPGRLFGAVNVVYGLDRTRAGGTGERTDSSSLALSGALSARVLDGILVGGELRYVRNYSGLALDQAAGDAFYAGPTFYVGLREGTFLAGGVGFKLVGREPPQASAAPSGSSKSVSALSAFERQQAVLRFGQGF